MRHKEGARRIVSIVMALALATMGLTAAAWWAPQWASANETDPELLAVEDVAADEEAVESDAVEETTADAVSNEEAIEEEAESVESEPVENAVLSDEASVESEDEPAAQADDVIVHTYDEEMVLHCPECNGFPHVSKSGSQGITGVGSGFLFEEYVELSDQYETTDPSVATVWIGEYEGKPCAFYQVQGVGTTDITVHTADGTQSATFRVNVTDVSDDPAKVAEFDHCQTLTGVEIVMPEDRATIDLAKGERPWVQLSTPTDGSSAGTLEYAWEFSSSDPSVAYVDVDSIVPVSVGTATITVTITDNAHPENGPFTDSITVNVIDSDATTPEVPEQGVITVSSGSDVLSGAATVNASDEAWAAFQEKAGGAAELLVVNAELSDTQAAAIEKAERVTLATWDVSMLDINDKAIEVTSEDGITLTVRLELSDEYAAYADDAFVVYYVGDDGTLEAKKTWVEEVEGVRFVCFETTHLSSYVLTVSNEAANEQLKPLDTNTDDEQSAGTLADTGDATGVVVAGAALCAVCAAGAAVAARKRAQR